MKSQVFQAAWFFFKGKIFSSFSEALKAAWRMMKLKVALLKGEVQFTYRKANGQIREAIGTLSSALLPDTKNIGSVKPYKPDVVKYYDMEKRAWRSFRVERLL